MSSYIPLITPPDTIVPDNKVAPAVNSTRAEIATIFKRYLDDFLEEGDEGE